MIETHLPLNLRKLRNAFAPLRKHSEGAAMGTAAALELPGTTTNDIVIFEDSKEPALTQPLADNNTETSPPPATEKQRNLARVKVYARELSTLKKAAKHIMPSQEHAEHRKRNGHNHVGNIDHTNKTAVVAQLEDLLAAKKKKDAEAIERIRKELGYDFNKYEAQVDAALPRLQEYETQTMDNAYQLTGVKRFTAAMDVFRHLLGKEYDQRAKILETAGQPKDLVAQVTKRAARVGAGYAVAYALNDYSSDIIGGITGYNFPFLADSSEILHGLQTSVHSLINMDMQNIDWKAIVSAATIGAGEFAFWSTKRKLVDQAYRNINNPDLMIANPTMVLGNAFAETVFDEEKDKERFTKVSNYLNPAEAFQISHWYLTLAIPVIGPTVFAIGDAVAAGANEVQYRINKRSLEQHVLTSAPIIEKDADDDPQNS